jgi:KaiC/GvpD/RAD55 family RecA-like ATPase
MVDKIPSGIPGLDFLINGGIRPNTINAVVGSSGTGKTTFCLQFLLDGLLRGSHGFYITMEEEPSQILEEAKLIGFPEIEAYADAEKLVFCKTSGRDFKKFIIDTLPEIVKKFKDQTNYIRTRVVIDPLTPLIWAIKDRNEQRELLSELFRLAKKLGTTVVTVEQHTVAKTDFIADKEITLPIFLSDYTFVFQYLGLGEEFDRGLRIIKTRGSSHFEGVFPVFLVEGFGIVVIPPEEAKERISQENSDVFQNAVELISNWNDPRKDLLLWKINLLQNNWIRKKAPDDVIQTILRSYHVI